MASPEEIAWRIMDYASGMAPEERDRCLELYVQFLVTYKNSEAFKAECERQSKAGISPLGAWFEKHEL